MRIVAVDAAARTGGIQPGLPLADARALLPTLSASPADPAADRRASAELADWCVRLYAMDGGRSRGRPPGNSALEQVCGSTSGCAHLFGGEEALLRDLLTRLEGLGFAARAAIAESAGAAWAIARFAGKSIAIVREGAVATALAPLPVQGSRLPPRSRRAATDRTASDR